MQDKVSSRSVDGLKLRRHLLRGAVVVFVTAGYSGKKFIFERVRTLDSRCSEGVCMLRLSDSLRQYSAVPNTCELIRPKLCDRAAADMYMRDLVEHLKG